MANGGRGAGSLSRLWFVAALGGASCALAPSEPAPVPPVPPAPGLSLDLLSIAKEPEAVEVSAALLTDPDAKIRTSAAINLYELGDGRPQLRPEIRRLHLPTQAVQEAAADGHAPPGWLRE